MNELDINHEDVLQVLKPSGPSVDAIADLMARLTALVVSPPPPPPSPVPGPQPEGPVAYWLNPVSSDEDGTADDAIKKLVGNDKLYAFGERTPGRKHLKPGDWMAFYATGKGSLPTPG